MRDNLYKKVNRSQGEDALLKELNSLGKLLDKDDFSLASPSRNCPSCGRPIK
ncbi:hypothetical protein GKD46_22540 [Parabacteroides distasonis]|jgi:hypothetical protein|nr:hypothetical protein [Parabacteroides distasonis]